MLEGRHGGLVGTIALGEENGPCLLYGDGYGCFEFPTWPQGFLWQVLLASLCCQH